MSNLVEVCGQRGQTTGWSCWHKGQGLEGVESKEKKQGHETKKGGSMNSSQQEDTEEEDEFDSEDEDNMCSLIQHGT